MSDPWADEAKTYPVHEESYALTKLFSSKGVKPLYACTVQEARDGYTELFKLAAGEINFDGQVKEISIPSPCVSSGIPATIYKPNELAETPVVLTYFHGGGLFILDRKCYETALKTIARDAGCIVVNVEYRLLPDFGKGHDPFNDAVVATKWVMENKVSIGAKLESKVGVGGDSAGGQLTACVTNDVRDLDFQVLVYPHVDTSLSQASVKEFVNTPGLSKADIEWFVDLLSKELPGHLTDPRVNAMTRTNTELSPPALVVLAQLDPIRDSGLVYAEKLRAAGIKVRIMVVEGVPHGFISMPKVFKTKCEEAYGHIVHFLKEFQ